MLTQGNQVNQHGTPLQLPLLAGLPTLNQSNYNTPSRQQYSTLIQNQNQAQQIAFNQNQNQALQIAFNQNQNQNSQLPFNQTQQLPFNQTQQLPFNPNQTPQLPLDQSHAPFGSNVFEVSNIHKSLIQESVENNADLELWELILRKYRNCANVAMIQVNIKQFVSPADAPKRLEPIRIPKRKKQIKINKNIQSIHVVELEQHNDQTNMDNEDDVLLHSNMVPKTIIKQNPNAKNSTSKHIAENKRDIISITDSGLSDEDFSCIYRYIIMNKTVNKRKIKMYDFDEDSIDIVLDVLVANKIVSNSNGYCTITARFDSKSKTWKPLKYNKNMDKTVYDKYNQYTQEYKESKAKKADKHANESNPTNTDNAATANQSNTENAATANQSDGSSTNIPPSTDTPNKKRTSSVAFSNADDDAPANKKQKPDTK